MGGKETYRQRFFVCKDHWKGPDSPIFFCEPLAARQSDAAHD